MAIWAQKSQVAKAIVRIVAIHVIQLQRNGPVVPRDSPAFHALRFHDALQQQPVFQFVRLNVPPIAQVVRKGTFGAKLFSLVPTLACHVRHVQIQPLDCPAKRRIIPASGNQAQLSQRSRNRG